MKFFNKSSKEKMSSEYTLKYGSISVAVVAVVLAIVLALNVAINILNQKFPMTLDFTIYDEFTMTEENLEFLETVDYPVELKVLFTKDQYVSGGLDYRNLVDETGKYFSQTINLLEQYKKYNDNIKITWLDPTNEDVITMVLQKYPEISGDVSYGDILVDCYVNGEKEEPKRGYVSVMDCYNLSADTDYTYYYYNTGDAPQYVTGNNIENAVANGIFKTANLETIRVALITANSSGAEENVSKLKETVGYNAYEITNCPEILAADFEKYKVMIICAPNEDYSAKECEKIKTWLDNDGKKGRTLLYFASAVSAKHKNLAALLEENGIVYESEYEYWSDDTDYYTGAQTNLFLETQYSEYTQTVDNGGYNYISNDMISMKAAFEKSNDGLITVESILKTADSKIYKKPVDAKSSWSPEGLAARRDAVLLSKQTNGESNSYIVAFSSLNFIINEDVKDKSENGNLRLIVNVLNATLRTDADEFVIAPKMVEDGTRNFVTSSTEAQNNIVKLVFIIAIPIALIAIAIFVYIRRKNY